MKRFFPLFLCLVLAFGCASPDKKTPAENPQPEPVDEKGLALATLSVINMREDPAYSAELGTQAVRGTPVKVHYHDPDYWVNIETPDGYKAWVNEMAIVPIDQARLDTWKETPRRIVTNYYTFFLDAPRPDANHVSDGVWGDIVEYVGATG